MQDFSCTLMLEVVGSVQFMPCRIHTEEGLVVAAVSYVCVARFPL